MLETLTFKFLYGGNLSLIKSFDIKFSCFTELFIRQMLKPCQNQSKDGENVWNRLACKPVDFNSIFVLEFSTRPLFINFLLSGARVLK